MSGGSGFTGETRDAGSARLDAGDLLNDEQVAAGMRQVRVGVPHLLEDGERDVPPLFRQLLSRLYQHLVELDDEVAALDRDIEVWHRGNADSQRVARVPAIGVLASGLTDKSPRSTVPRRLHRTFRQLRGRCRFEVGLPHGIRVGYSCYPLA
jgi:transposase